MADAETNSQKVATGIMKIMADARLRDTPPRMVGVDLTHRGVNLMAGGITWVDESYQEPASGLTKIIGNPFVRPSPAPEPDTPASRDLANALAGTIAAGTWNGTSFGRK